MIGLLPKTLKINDTDYAIRSDFRIALRVLEAYNDPDLSDYDKAVVCLQCIYPSFDSIPKDDIQSALELAYWFLDGGDSPKTKTNERKVIDWKQDERIIFPAINKVAGYETRSTEYLHWWSFLGLFGEIGEGLLSTVLSIRQKKAKGKKLDKWEQTYYRENKELIDIKTPLSAEEQAEADRLNELLG